jgi:hypothetical protein
VTRSVTVRSELMYRYEGEPSEELGPFGLHIMMIFSYRLIEKHISLDFLFTRVKIRLEQRTCSREAILRYSSVLWTFKYFRSNFAGYVCLLDDVPVDILLNSFTVSLLSSIHYHRPDWNNCKSRSPK